MVANNAAVVRRDLPGGWEIAAVDVAIPIAEVEAANAFSEPAPAKMTIDKDGALLFEYEGVRYRYDSLGWAILTLDDKWDSRPVIKLPADVLRCFVVAYDEERVKAKTAPRPKKEKQ